MKNNILSEMQKEAVKFEMGWSIQCVSCGCSELWGSANMARCWWRLLKLLRVPLPTFSEAEERKCWWVVSVSTLYPSHSFSVFNEYEAPQANALKPSALLSLPLHFWVFPALSLQFTVFLLPFPKKKTNYLWGSRILIFRLILIIIIMFIFAIKMLKCAFYWCGIWIFVLLISSLVL